ncbi:MAG: DUF802 domain-containing protein [Burkholderiales bacterium]|nr:MAG: DUF802 domain-containing protein [Burkholderiales bacterium]
MTPETSRFSRILFVLAFVTGLAVVGWVASGFVGTSAFALGMTVLIGLVYLAGAWELLRFGQATAQLRAAMGTMGQPLNRLADWLQGVPATLQDAVRQRIENERSAFPGPALTPYLVGLLVMLGMLGTFLGMVVTFKGAVFALEGSADLTAIRSALAAPIKGLGLSFGTSVAGVATSAMLGLMATVARRERAQALRALDLLAATTLRPFTAAHQRQQSLEALQRQADALPAAAQHLQALIGQMERRSQQLDEQLLARQAEFQREAAAAYTALAQSVQRSLSDSLVASARAASDGLQPVVQQAMAGIAAESSRLHEGVSQAVQAQLACLSSQFGATAATVADTWTRALAQHEQGGRQLLQGLAESLAAFNHSFDERAARLVAQTEALVQNRAESEAAWTRQQGQRMDELAALWRSELAALRSEEAQRGEAAVQRLADLQAALATQLATLGCALEAPMARLMQAAADAPRAAAEVIAQLREQMGLLAERDNATLAERADLIGQIGNLLQQVQQTTGEQRAAIEHLVGSATGVLDRVGRQFADTVGAQAERAEVMAGQAATSAAQLASLGQAFEQGTRQLAASHEQLAQSLQHVQAAIEQSLSRSDEQLAYYVAQAREVIDLSISAQQGIIDDLRRLKAPARSTTGAAQ